MLSPPPPTRPHPHPTPLGQLSIHDFYPLVYHEHPGATAIVQRLGRIMVRFEGGGGDALGVYLLWRQDPHMTVPGNSVRSSACT